MNIDEYDGKKVRVSCGRLAMVGTLVKNPSKYTILVHGAGCDYGDASFSANMIESIDDEITSEYPFIQLRR